MQKSILGISISIAMILLSSACAPNQNSNNAQETSGEANQEAVGPASRQCFGYETQHEVIPEGLPESAETKDIMELIVVLDGGNATGQYNWVPAFKDQRLGSFSGSFQDNIVNATYEYQQEGQVGKTEIVISIEEEQASVEGGEPALGLAQTLPRVECQNDT